MFSPPEEYIVVPKDFELRDFREYPELFILRPPYQRYPRVWKLKMKEKFLDSLFRGYYIPKIVLREVIIGNEKRYEVIDGQQRITTILEFFDKDSQLKTPETLRDLGEDIPNKKYQDLSPDKRTWIDKKISLKADIIMSISDKDNSSHLSIAADLFFRLQQGEPLTKIESFHSKLGSNVRNFVSLYSDDYSFDYKHYRSLDQNVNKHPFFSRVIDISNDRMQHLLLLTRFLIVEFENGSADVGGDKLENFFLEKFPLKSKSEQIDNDFINLKEVKNCLSNIQLFNNIYKNNPMIDEKNGVKYLRKDYYILSLYLLLRHLKNHYVFDQEEYKMFDEFSSDFYIRLTKNDQEDFEILRFRENRQQSKENLEIRDRIIRKAFFEKNKDLKLKDNKRNFNEPKKIEIYIRDKGLCQECLKEGKSEEESKVSWSQYDADHILAWIKGGQSETSQGRVLCRFHNRSKGSR